MASLVFRFQSPVAVRSFSYDTGIDKPDRDPTKIWLEGRNGDGSQWQILIADAQIRPSDGRQQRTNLISISFGGT